MDRVKLEQKHYDIRAKGINPAIYSWESGSRGINPALRAPYEFCEQWIRKHCSNKKILDYGCGHGVHAIFPAKNGAFVVGVDISPESLKFAKQRAIREGVGKSTFFEVGNCEALRFNNNAFDVVFSGGTLSCLNLQKAYSELARVIKPDGYVVIVDTLGHNPLLNLNRYIKFKRGIRTQQTAKHILRIEDLYKAKEFFNKLEIHFFDLATLAIAPFVKGGANTVWMIKAIKRVDQFLFYAFPFVSKYAFKVVCILSEPNKIT